MIPRKYKASDLKGRKARLVRELTNWAGQVISEETIVTITRARYGIEVKTETCKHCGQSAYIRKIRREDLALVEI